MAYVPPHKRVSQTQEGPPPTPTQMIPQFKKNSNLNSSRRGSDRRTNKNTSHGMKVIYANYPLNTRWLAVPLTGDALLPSSVCLAPVSLKCIGQQTEQKSLILVNNNSKQESNDIKSCDLEQTWASVAETVYADLLSAFENLSNQQVDHNTEEIKPKVIARFGKVIFRWNPSVSRDFNEETTVSKSYVKHLRRFFHTDVPLEYIEHIRNVVVPDFGVEFEEEKEIYRVQICDAKRPKTILSCKCRVLQDEKKLELYKIELNYTRDLVMDISCLDSNVDLRLALCTNETLTALQDEGVQGIRDIISSAVIDSNVKGGLRWPLGEKTNTGGQYNIAAVWHTKTESYVSSSVRLKIRLANRYDFLASSGEVTREVILRLRGMTRNLLDQGNEAGGGLAMLKDELILIRNHFLAWDGHVVSCSDSYLYRVLRIQMYGVMNAY